MEGSLCGLGQTAPNPALSSLRYFKDEYIAHINGTCLICLEPGTYNQALHGLEGILHLVCWNHA